MEQKKNAAKFAFFYLLSLAGLVFVSISVGAIIFQLINKLIEDPAYLYSGVFSNEAVKFGISAIFVSAPIFYIINRIIQKSLYKGELEKDSGVRRWLIYFILFVSSVVMIGWLIGIIMNFLNGEITIKFILKALTSLAIAAGIFSFYLYDIKREDVHQKKDKVVAIYTWSSLIIVVAVFVLGFFIMESPQESRNKKLDDQVLEDFRVIDNCINDYYSRNKTLPASLEEVKSECNYIIRNLADSETGKDYEYNKKEDKKYNLCADFRTSNKDDAYDSRSDYMSYTPGNKSDLHETGWQCLEREVYYMEDSERAIKQNPETGI